MGRRRGQMGIRDRKRPVVAPPHVVGPPAVAGPGPVVAIADPAGHGAPLLDVAPAAADVEDDGDGLADTVADGGTGVGAKIAADRTEDEKFRSSSLGWISADTVQADAVRLSIVMHAHSWRVSSKLFISGEQWERSQPLLCARKEAEGAVVAGSEARVPELPRNVRLLEAYDGVADKSFLREMEDLMRKGERWDCVPPTSRTNASRTQAFKLLVRGRARVHR